MYPKHTLCNWLDRWNPDMFPECRLNNELDHPPARRFPLHTRHTRFDLFHFERWKGYSPDTPNSPELHQICPPDREWERLNPQPDCKNPMKRMYTVLYRYYSNTTPPDIQCTILMNLMDHIHPDCRECNR